MRFQIFLTSGRYEIGTVVCKYTLVPTKEFKLLKKNLGVSFMAGEVKKVDSCSEYSEKSMFEPLRVSGLSQGGFLSIKIFKYARWGY